MLSTRITPLVFLLAITHLCNGQNLTIFKSSNSVSQTTEKLVSLIKQHELVYFETVVHDEIASKRNLEISPTRVVLFEDPDLITGLIQCNQTTALDLPLKILVWEENEDVYIGFVDPKLMSKRFLLQDCDDLLDDLARLMLKLANNVIRSS